MSRQKKQEGLQQGVIITSQVGRYVSDVVPKTLDRPNNARWGYGPQHRQSNIRLNASGLTDRSDPKEARQLPAHK
jgi:hypothetical protein